MYLYHYAVSFLKRVQYILQCNIYLRNFAGYERLRFFKTIPEPATKNFTSHQLLVTPHNNVLWIMFIIGMIGWVYIYQLDNKIRIRSSNGLPKIFLPLNSISVRTVCFRLINLLMKRQPLNISVTRPNLCLIPPKRKVSHSPPEDL